LRVLLIVSELPPVTSGVARSVDRLRLGLIERGHSVDAVSSSTEWRWYVHEFRIPFGAKRLIRYPSVVGSYDVVGLHGPSPFYSDAILVRSLMAAAADRFRPRARRRVPPMVYTHHFSVVVDGVRPLCGPYNWGHRFLAKGADAVVVTTESYRDQLRAVGVSEPHIVPWGADEPTVAARSLPKSPLKVLLVGQMRPYKGVHVLVEAAAGLEGVEVTIVGGGPEEHNYRELAHQLGGTNIRFTGRISDEEVADLRAEHHVAILPSINEMEAFGIVLVEGMMAGCVPVASDLPGVRDVVGEAGFTFAPGSVSDLRSLLGRLRDFPEGLANYRVRAMDRGREFTWTRSVDKYEQVLHDAVARREG
jgi:rhamnosyl/mannosyltransferase